MVSYRLEVKPALRRWLREANDLERRLDLPVVSERRVSHLDDNKNILGSGWDVLIKVAPPSEDYKVRLGLAMQIQSHRALHADDRAPLEALDEELVEAVDGGVVLV